jgi:hypothetical protein
VDTLSDQPLAHDILRDKYARPGETELGALFVPH